MYAVAVTVSRKRNGWSESRTLPTFYLSEHVQGIVSESHAWKIALDIIDPRGERLTDPTLTIDCVVVGPELTAIDLGHVQPGLNAADFAEEEVVRLRAQVAAVERLCQERKTGGSPLLSGREILAVLASGDEEQP